MNCVKIIFTPKEAIEDIDEITSLFWDYLACLFKNGQILEDYLFIKNDGKYMAFATLPEDDALDEEHNNIYVSKYLAEVKNHFELSTEIVGENMDAEESCKCAEKPDWYMLYTSWTDEESPVVCGKCGKSVPLYKLPHILGEDEHYSVLYWKKAYRSVDRLFMYCKLSHEYEYPPHLTGNMTVFGDGLIL